MATALPSRFFKYACRSTAKIVLETGKLRWSTPELFNDPYDLQFDLHIDASREAVRARGVEKAWNAWYGESYTPHPGNPLGRVIQALRDVFPKLSRAEFEQEWGPAMDESFDEAMAALPELHAQFQASMRKSKVLFQSETPDSLLMWAYYAEQHKGAVLCFTADPVRDSAWLQAKPMQYRRAMPRLCDEELLSDFLAGLAVLDVKTLVNRIIYTKAAEWSHEREWRLEAGNGRQPDAEFEDVPFYARELHGVIFGCATPQADKDALSATIRDRYPHASIYATRKDEREFRLVIDGLPPQPRFAPTDTNSATR